MRRFLPTAALIRACQRGVQVRITLDGRPRTPRANEAVIRMLHRALGGGRRVATHPMDGAPWGKLVRPRLHEKLYCFSHPEPVVFVGSFNPSGDAPEEEPTLRRVTPRAEEQLRAAGVSIRRVVHPDGLPMHAKFALVDGRGERRVVFGSFNWTEPSRRFNREIGVIASDPQLFGSFEERWKVFRDGCAESPGH